MFADSPWILENARFLRQLAALLNAGVPIQQALSMAGRDCSKELQKALQIASQYVATGQGLAESLKLASSRFDRWTLSLIYAAEESGALPETCDRLANNFEIQIRRRRLYRSVAFFCLLLMLGSCVFIFALMQRSLHFLWLPRFWIWLLVVSLAFWGLLRWTNAQHQGQALLRSLSRLPIITPIVEARSMIYLSELAIALQSGLSLLQGLDLLQRRIPDPVLVTTQQVKQGHTLSQGLAGKVPLVAFQMVRVGEETGDLGRSLQKMGEYYDGNSMQRYARLR